MKLLIDNNLSYKLCTPLMEHFNEVCHVRDLLSATADDLTIWNYAKANNFQILTKDNDFDEWSLLKGCPPKIIHLLCGNQTTLFILDFIVTNKEAIRNFIRQSPNDCILKLHT
jgi:predicted nuclease of predicted toxin-antitoxin system